MRLSARHVLRLGVPLLLLALTLVAVLPRSGGRSALAGVEMQDGILPSAEYCGLVIGTDIFGGIFCVTTNSTATGIVSAVLIDYPTTCGLLNLSQTFNPYVPIIGGTFTFNGSPFNFQGTFVGGGSPDSEAKSIAVEGDYQSSPDIVGLFSVTEGTGCQNPSTNEVRLWNAFFDGPADTATPTPTPSATATATATATVCVRGCATATATVTPTATTTGCLRNCETATATATASATATACGRDCATATATVTPTATAPGCLRNCPTVTPTSTVVVTQEAARS